MSTQGIEPRRVTRRIMLPDTARITREAADIEDARKIRYGVSPSYYINLGHLVGGQYTGYGAIYPRRLYRFAAVHPTGINEDQDRVDEESPELPAIAPMTRTPRTCAEDVKTEADDRVFVILSSLIDRDDVAQEVWDLVYPIEVEAEIFAMTDRAFRGPTPEHLIQVYESQGLPFPYVTDGHALAAFIAHLEKSEQRLIAELDQESELYQLAEATRLEALQGASDAYRHRYTRLHVSFGLIDAKRNGGKGRSKLEKHDFECLKETGIERPEDKPVLASQKMGAEIGDAITKKAAESEGALAVAVAKLAEGQETQNKILQLLVEERAGKIEIQSAA